MPSPLRIRLRKTASGPDFGPFSPGQELTLPYARARELIDSGQAEYLGSVGPDPDVGPEQRPSAPAVERAVQRQPEAATAPPQRGDAGGPLPTGNTARNLTGQPEKVDSGKLDSKASDKTSDKSEKSEKSDSPRSDKK
jgi:hypothetical protein